MKYYSVGFDAGICYSCNIIKGETEAACKYAAEQHAKKYGYAVGYFNEISAEEAENDRKPVWRADRYPQPEEPAEQPETESTAHSADNNEEENTMKKYDYLESMKSNVLDFIAENVSREEYTGSREELEERLNEDCWTADSVTGNASGSYYCNAYKAAEAISGNLELLCEALDEFGGEAEQYKKALLSPEYADCTIRCYLLGQAVSEVLDMLEEAGYFEESEADESDILREVAAEISKTA